MNPPTIEKEEAGIRYHPDRLLQYIGFDTEAFPFRRLIEEHLRDAIGCDRLEDFHNHIPADRLPTDPMEGTAHTYGHDLLYAVDPAFRQAGIVEARERGFMEIYRRFMHHLQEDVFQEPVIFQRRPSMRIQYPECTSYGLMHRDSEFNHPADEINIWLPITEVRGSATMVIESEIDKGDYRPVELPFGEYVVFNSALMHGNIVNEEGYTRFSIDMRVIPLRIYQEASNTFSATTHTEFVVGGYYDRFD